jgi:hypothetical protein
MRGLHCLLVAQQPVLLGRGRPSVLFGRMGCNSVHARPTQVYSPTTWSFRRISTLCSLKSVRIISRMDRLIRLNLESSVKRKCLELAFRTCNSATRTGTLPEVQVGFRMNSMQQLHVRNGRPWFPLLTTSLPQPDGAQPDSRELLVNMSPSTKHRVHLHPAL